MTRQDGGHMTGYRPYHIVDDMRLNAILPAVLLTVQSAADMAADDIYSDVFGKYINHVSASEYKGEDQIWAVETSPDGYVFIGAGNNLCVWDGYIWDSYTIDGYSVIRDLAYDDGRLWCAGDNIFGYWKEDAYGDFRFTGLYRNEDRSRNEIFWQIIPAGDRLYVRTYGSVSVFDRSSGTKTDIYEGYCQNIFSSGDRIYAQTDGRISVLGSEGFIPVTGPVDENIVWFETMPDGYLMIGTKSGFIGWDDRTGFQMDLFPETNRILKEAKIFCAARLGDGNYIIGTDQDGAKTCSPDGRIISEFDASRGLRYTSVLSIADNTDGDIFLGLAGGLAVIRNSMSERYYMSPGINPGAIYAIAIHNGKLLVGTDMGLYRIGVDGTPVPVPGMEGSHIWDICPLDNDLAIINGEGLYVQDGDSFRMLLPHTWKMTGIYGKPDLFCASGKFGLCILRLDDDGLHIRNRIRNYDNPDNSISSDEYGNLWVDGLNGKVKRLIPDSGLTGIMEEKVYEVPSEGTGIIKAASIDGKVVFTSGKRCFSYSPARDSIVLNEYYTRICSSFTSSSLNLFQKDNWFFNYSDSGQIEAICRSGNGFIKAPDLFLDADKVHIPEYFRKLTALDDSLVACGFINMAACINISQLSTDRHRRDSVRVRKISYDIKGEQHKMDMLRGRLVLPHEADDLCFRIASGHNSRLLYRFDETEWQPVPHGMPITADYMKSGRHVLEIKDTGNNISRFPFTIRQSFIARWWICFAAAAAGVIIYVISLWKDRQRTRKKSEMLEEKIREMEKKLLVATLKDISDSRSGESGNWNTFEIYFNSIFDGFLDRLKDRYPKLTANDLKICAFIRTGMSTKDIAAMLHINLASAESARYRLRKNMGLTPDESLKEVIMDI